MTVPVAPAEIVSFWSEAGPDKWFEQDESFDQAIRLRFLLTYEAAANGELVAWEENVEGALARGFDQATDLALRPFFYLPFMHSEALIDQDRSVSLYEALGESEQLRYATEHRDVIQIFGRFPHRNRALGRDTTRAEEAF